MPALQIVCLANSRKYQGRCVAGLRADGGGWVRPLGHGHDGSLTHAEITLDNGSQPQLLDLIEVDVSRPSPQPHQPENWIIGRRRWRLVSRPAPAKVRESLRPYLVRGPELFGDQSDRLPFADFCKKPAASSLALIYPASLQWRVRPAKTSGHWNARACFTLGGATYDLGLTDPLRERRLCVLQTGTHPAMAAGFTEGDRLLLTVSLGEPFNDYCYKLVAGVVAIPRSWSDKS